MELKPAQRKVVAARGSGGRFEVTRAEYEDITGVRRSQAAYDLAELVDAGVLSRVGSGRMTRYRLAEPAASRKRRWTDERIGAELRAFCAGSGSWPAAAEFARAGRRDLYLAASRYGGVDFWAGELGFRPSAPEEHCGSKEEPASRSRGLRPRLMREELVWVLVVLFLAPFLFTLERESGDRDGFLGTAARAGAPAVSAPPFRAAPGKPSATLPATDARRRAATKRAADAVGVVHRPGRRPERNVLVLAAVRGDCWLEARVGSVSGRTLYEGVLRRGTSLRLAAKAIWLRLGAPGNVVARLNGERTALLPATTASIIVTGAGVARARSTGGRVGGESTHQPARGGTDPPAQPIRQIAPPPPPTEPVVESSSAIERSGPAPLPAPELPPEPAPLPAT